MKKLAVIIAMALILTVGGVYATFNYAQNGAADANESVGTTVAASAANTEKGVISIDSTYAVHVDDVNNDLTTGSTVSGTTKITFTPNKGSDADVKTNGIKLKLVITVEGDNEYDGSAIFSLKNYTEGGIILNGGNKVLGEITVDLSDYISVTAISLPTAADYEAYKTAFNSTHISITVSEAA